MRRLIASLVATVVVFALLAPAAMAQNSGEGLYGETNDRVVTYAGFILILFFPTVILVFSLIMWRLEKRKDARKKAIKARGGEERWRGGW